MKWNKKIKNNKPCRLRALPHVGVAVTPLCEQVHNGRANSPNCTTCQPTLWKKPNSLSLGKNLD